MPTSNGYALESDRRMPAGLPAWKDRQVVPSFLPTHPEASQPASIPNSEFARCEPAAATEVLLLLLLLSLDRAQALEAVPCRAVPTSRPPAVPLSRCRSSMPDCAALLLSLLGRAQPSEAELAP